MRWLIAFLLSCQAASAAVINAASSSWLDVSNAVFSASDFDTVQIPISSNAWAGELKIEKTGLRLSGAGTTNTIGGGAWICNVTANIQGQLLNCLSNSITISNITFCGTNSTLISGGFWGRAVDLAGPYCRMTRCCLKWFDTAAISAYPGTVVYKCMFLDNRLHWRTFGPGDGSSSWTAFGPASAVNYSSTNFSFWEDNVIDQSPSMPNDTSVGSSSQQGQLIVNRYNRFTFRSPWDYSPIFDFHGPTSGGPLRGGIGFLLAYNFIDLSGVGASFDRLIDIRGGSAIVHDNTITNYVDTGRQIHMRRDDDDAALFFQNGGIEQCTNIWAWNNTQNGTLMAMTVEANDATVIVGGLSYTNIAPSFAYDPPYPMPLRDDALTTVANQPRNLRIRGVRLNQ